MDYSDYLDALILSERYGTPEPRIGTSYGAKQKKYFHSEKGRAAQKRYDQTDKGKERWKRYYQRKKIRRMLEEVEE